MNSSARSSVLLISLEEAASRISVSKRTIEREIQRGRFPRPVKVGRSTRVPVSDLEAYVEALRSPTARKDHIQGFRTKSGGMIAQPEILEVIDKMRPAGMTQAEYEKAASDYHGQLEEHS